MLTCSSWEKLGSRERGVCSVYGFGARERGRDSGSGRRNGRTFLIAAERPFNLGVAAASRKCLPAATAPWTSSTRRKVHA